MLLMYKSKLFGSIRVALACFVGSHVITQPKKTKTCVYQCTTIPSPRIGVASRKKHETDMDRIAQ